jgi:hypothetical protein
MYVDGMHDPTAPSYPANPFKRRQKEAEQKLIETEVAKRVAEQVEKRVADELEKRKDEIEIEVKRRVEEAKVQMELKLIEEFERKKQDELKRQKDKEVRLAGLLWFFIVKTRIL